MLTDDDPLNNLSNILRIQDKQVWENSTVKVKIITRLKLPLLPTPSVSQVSKSVVQAVISGFCQICRNVSIYLVCPSLSLFLSLSLLLSIIMEKFISLKMLQLQQPPSRFLFRFWLQGKCCKFKCCSEEFQIRVIKRTSGSTF